MEGEDVSGGDVMGMGLGDGDVSADVMEKGSLSPLTGSYLLIVLAEPHSEEDREIILQRLNKGLLSWNVDTSHVDLNCELLNLANSGPEGDEARNGEKLVQWASENLVVEVLIHSQVNTLQQCMKNLLASFTRHRHIIHAGYTFQGSGSWVLQDGTFSLSDYLELWGEAEVQRILSAYKGDISVSMHCASENGWTQERFDKEPFAKLCQTTMNPPDKMSTAHNSGIGTFIEYISKMLIPTPLKEILEPSDIVGNIRFSHPTLYVFPGGQGDAALFGINGFNMLIDGGFSRKSCFWDFTRHLDRLDAVLLTRVNNNSVGGLSSVIQRKVMNQVYPQIGHFFGNVLERRGAPGGGGGGGEKHEKESGGGEGNEQQEKLLVSLNDEGQKMVENLRNISLKPHLCFRETHIEPINLYHKVGHGKLDLYVLNPARDSREVKDFLSKWNSDCKSFVSSRISSRHDGKDFQFPVLNLVSICALLVWQPANPRDPITRILFPGSTPQYKIFEALQKLKHLEFLKYPVCTGKTIAASNKSKVKSEKIISEAKQQLSKVGGGSHGEGGGGLNQQQPSSTDGSLSRTALTKTATSSSSTFSHRSSSRTKAAMAAATSSSKEDIQPSTKERVSSRRLVSKSSAGPDSNKIPLKSDSPIHKKQIKSTIASSKVSSSSTAGLGSGKTSSSTKIPAKGPLKSGSGKIGKETSTTTTTTTTASMTPSTGAKKASPTSPAKSKIGLKGKTGVGLTKASTISSDTPPQTPPKSAKDANNRRVIETKTKLKSNVKTETQKQTAHSKVEDIKRRATSKVSSIPKSVPSKSPTHTPSGVAVKRITSAKKPVKDTKEKVVGKALSTATNLPDDIEEEEKKIKVETNGSIIRDEVAKSDELDGDQETETELEPDSQPSSLPPAFLPTESGSELSSLDHISVHEQDGPTVSEDLSLSVISKDQFESETLQGDGVAESEQDEEEEEYLIVEKDESTTDNVESEKILAKNIGSLDESCPTTPQIPTEAETDSFIPASELLEELEKEIIAGDGDGEGDGEETTEEVQADAESEKESLTEISPAPQQEEDGGADESSAAVSHPAVAAPSEKTDEENVLEKLETEIPSDPEKGQDEDKVDVAAGEKDEECDQVEEVGAAEAATTADESENVDVESKDEAEAEDEKEGKVSEEKEVEEGEGEGEDMTSMKNVPETDSSRLELKDDVEPSESQSEKVTEEVGPPGEDEEGAGESSQKLSELSSSKNEEDIHEASHPVSLPAEGGEGEEEGDADTDKTATTLPAGESSEQQTIEEKVGEGEGEGGESGEKDKVEGETCAPSEELPGNNEASTEQDKVEKDEGVAVGGEKEDLEKLEEETPEGKKDLPDDIDETTQDKLPGHGKTAAETTVAESSEPELQQPEQLEETTTSTSTGAQEEGEGEGQVQEAESSSASQQKESGAQVEDAGAGAGAGSEEDAKVEVEVDEPTVTATVVEQETKLPAELEINDNDETVSKLKEEQLPDLSTLEKSIEQELQEQQDTQTTTTTAETAENLNQQDEINEDKTKQLSGTDQEQEEPKDQTQVEPESIKEDTTATSSTPPQVPLESEAGTETETGTGAELEGDTKDKDERRASQVIETVNLGTEDEIEKTEASASGTTPEPQKDEVEKGESHISSESEKRAAIEEEKVEKIETEIEAISQDPAIPIDESKEGKADEEKIDEICKEEEISKNKLDISQSKIDEDQKEKEDEIKSESVPTTQRETEETESIQGADEKLESEESKESVQEEKLDTLLAESEPSAQTDDVEVTKETETEKDSDITAVESSETEAQKEEIIETQEPLLLSHDSKSKSEEVTSEEKSEITEKEVVGAEDTSDSIIIPQEISTDTTPEKVTQKLDDSGKTGSTQDDALETGDKQELDISEAPATAVKLGSQKEIIDDAKEEDISQDTATTLETAEKSEITPKEDSPVEGEVAKSSEIPQDTSQLAEEEQQEIISEETCQKTDAVETAPQSLAEEIEIATELEVAEKAEEESLAKEKKAEDDTLQSQEEEAEKKSEEKPEEKAEEKVEVKADVEASETVAEKSESETTGTADEKTESADVVDEKSVTGDAHTEEAITTGKDEAKSQVLEKSAETEATEIASAQQSTTVITTETEVTKTDEKPEATQVADEKLEATEVSGEKSDAIDVADKKPEVTEVAEEKSKVTEVAGDTSGAVELEATEKPEVVAEPETVEKSEAVGKTEISDAAEKQVAVEKVEETTESVIDSKDEETLAEVPATEASLKQSDDRESKEDTTKSDEKPEPSNIAGETELEVSEKPTDDKQEASEKKDDTAQTAEGESIEQEATVQISEKPEASEAAVESEKPDDKQEPPSKVSDISDESKEADSTKEVTDKPEAEVEETKTETSAVQDDAKLESDEKADVAPEVGVKSGATDKAEEKSTVVADDAADEKPVETDVKAAQEPDATVEATPTAKQEVKEKVDESSEKIEKTDDTQETLGASQDDEGKAEEKSTEIKTAAAVDEDSKEVPADEEQKQTETVQVEKLETVEKSDEKSQVEKDEDKPETSLKIDDKSDTTQKLDDKSDEIDKAAGEKPAETDKVSGTQEVSEKAKDEKSDEAEEEAEKDQVEEPEKIDEQTESLVIAEETPSSKTSEKDETAETAEGVQVETEATGTKSPEPVDKEQASGSVDEKLESSSSVVVVEAEASDSKVTESTVTTEESKEIELKDLDKSDVEKDADQLETTDDKKESEIIEKSLEKSSKEEPSETKEDTTTIKTTTSEVQEEAIVKEIPSTDDKSEKMEKVEKSSEKESIEDNLDNSSQAGDKSQIPQETTTTDGKSEEQIDTLVNWEITVGAQDTAQKDDDDDTVKLEPASKEAENLTGDKEDTHVKGETTQASEKIQIKSSDEEAQEKGGEVKADEKSQQSEPSASSPQIKADKPSIGESIGDTAEEAGKESERKSSVTPPQEGEQDEEKEFTKEGEKADDLLLHDSETDKKMDKDSVLAVKTGDKPAQLVASIAKSEETELVMEEKSEEKQDTAPEKADKQDYVPSPSSSSSSTDKKEKESSADENLKEETSITYTAGAAAVEETTAKSSEKILEISDKSATDTIITGIVKSEEICTEKVDGTSEKAELSRATVEEEDDDNDNQAGDCEEKQDNDTEKSKEEKTDLIQAETASVVSAETTGSLPKEPLAEKTKEEIPAVSPTSDNKLKGEKSETLEPPEKVKSPEPEPEPDSAVLEPPDIGTPKQQPSKAVPSEKSHDLHHANLGTTLIETESDPEPKVESTPTPTTGEAPKPTEKPSEKVELQTEEAESGPEAVQVQGSEATPSKDQPEPEKSDLAQEDNGKEGETATEAEVQSASKPEADTDQSDLKNVQSPTKSTATGAAPDLESELISAEEEKDGGEDEKEETEDKVRSTLYVEDEEDEEVVEGATKRVVDKDDPKFIRPLPYQETITSEEGMDTLLKEGKQLAEIQAAEINKIKEQEEKIPVGIPSAIPSKLPRVSREVIRTPDEVADLPVHEEVEPGTYETDPVADPESLSEEDPGVEAIEIAKLPSSKSPSPSPTPALRPIVGDLAPSSPSLQDPNQEQDQDHVSKVDVHPATIILPTETEIAAAVVTKIDAAVSPVLESLLGQSPPKTFPPTPSTPSPSPDPSPSPTPAESAAAVAVPEKKSDDKSSPPPSPSADSKIPDKDLQIQTQPTDIQKIESPVELEKDSQLKEKEEILVVEQEKEEGVSQEVKVTDKTEEADVVDMTHKNLEDENKIGDVKSDEETKGAGDDDDKNETKDIKMIDITVAPEEEEEEEKVVGASELAAKPITSVVITPSTPPVSIAGKSEFNYSQDKQSGPSSPQTAQTTETKEEGEEVVPSVESAQDGGKDVQVERSGASALSSSEIHETESPKLDQNEMDENVKIVESSTATSTSTITLLTDERERQLSNSDESSPSSPTPLTAVVSEEVVGAAATGKVSDEQQQQQQGAEAAQVVQEKITEQLNKSEEITASHVPSSASATVAAHDVDTGDVKVKTVVKKVGAEKLFLLPGKKEDDEDDKSDVDDEDIYETDEPVLGAIRAGLLTAATTLSAAVIAQSPEDLAIIPTLYESEEHRAKSAEASAKSPKSPPDIPQPERTQEKVSKDEEADLTGRSSSPETKTLHQLSHLQQEQEQQDDSTTTTTSEIKTVEIDTIAPETITTTTAEQLESGFNDAEKIQSSSISILESETTDRHEKGIIIGGDSGSSTTTTTTTTTTITTKLIDDDIPSKTDQPATPINTTIDSDEKEIIIPADSGSASAVGSILVECGTNIVQEKTSMEIGKGEAAVAVPSTSTEELANKLVSTQLEQEQVDTTPTTSADQEQDGKDDTNRPSISKIETEAGKGVVSENEKSITSPQSSESPSDIKDKEGEGEEEEVRSCIAASASGPSTEINQSSSKDESALASDSSNIQSTPEIPSPRTPAAPTSQEAEVASPSPSTDDLQTKLDSGVHNIDIVGSSSSVDVSAKVISVNDRPPAALAVDRTETVAEEKDSIQEQESLVILSVDETSTSLVESASDKVIGDLATELIESLNNAEKVVSSVLQAVESQVEAKIKLAEQVLEEVEGKLESAATPVSSPLAEQEKQIEDDSGRESIITGAGESEDISVSPVQQGGSASVGKSIVIDDANVMGALSEGDGNGNLAEQRDAEEEEEEEEIVDVEMVDVEGEATEQLIVLDRTEGDSSGKSIGAPLTSTSSHRSSVSSDVDVGSASEHLASSQSQFQSVAKEKDCGGGGEEVANLDHIMDVGPDLDSSTTITSTTTPSQLDLGQETSVPSQSGEKSSSATVTRTEAQSDIEKPLEISSTSPISLTSISSTTTAQEIISESKTTTEIPLDSTHVSVTSDMTILKSSLQDSTSSLDLTESTSTMVQSSEGLSSTSAIASTSSFISSSTEREIEERTTSRTSSKGPPLSSMGGSDSAYSGGGSLSLTEIEEIINVTSSSEGAGKVESVPGSMHSPRGDEDASAAYADPNILSSIKDFVEISDAKETTTTTETTFPSSSIESEIIESGGEKSGDLNSELSAIKVSTEEKSSSIISQEINYKVSSSVVESGAVEVNVTDSHTKDTVVSHGEEIKMEGDSKVVHQVESSASTASTLTSSSSSSSSTVASQSKSQSTSAAATTVEKKSDSISVSVRDGGLESKIESSTTSGSEIQIGEVTSSPSALSPKTESVERKKDEGEEETRKSSGGSGSRRVSESLGGDLSKAEGGETSHSSMYTLETSAQLINLAEEKEKSNIEQVSQAHKTHTISSTSLHSSISSSSSTTATAASAPTHTDTNTGIVMEKEDVTTSESGASRLQFSTEESSTKIGEEKKKDEILKSTSYSSSSGVTETLAPSTSSTSATTSSTSSTSKTVQDSSSSLASEKTSTSTSQFVHAKSDVLESQSIAGSSYSSGSSSSSGGSVSGVTAKPTVGDSVIKSSTTGGTTSSSSSSSSSSTSASSGTSKSVITRRFSSQEVCRDLEKKESAGFVSGRRRASEIIEHSEEIIPAGSSSSSTSSPVVVVATGGAEEAESEAGTSTSTSSSITTEYVKVDREKEMSRTSPGGSFYGGYGYVFGSAADDEAEENPTDEESVYGEDSQSHSLSTRDSNQSIILSSDTLPTDKSSTTTTTTTVVDKCDSGSGTITTTTTTTVLTHSSSPQPIQLEEKLLSLEKETRTTLGDKVEKGSSYFPVSHDLGDEGSYSSGDFSDSQLSMVAGGKDDDGDSYRLEKKVVVAEGSVFQDAENGNTPSGTSTTSRTVQESSSSSSSGASGLSAVVLSAGTGGSPIKITTISSKSSTSTTIHTVTDPKTGKTTRTEVTKESGASGSGSEAAAGSSFSSEFEFSSTAAPSSSSRQKEAEGDDILKSWGKPLGLPPVQSEDPAAPSSTNPSVEPAESSTGLAKGTPKKDKSVDRKNPGTPAKSSGAGHSTSSRGRSHHRSSKNTNPIYVDLAYVPHHGNSNYCDSEFFRLVRSRYYVFSGLEPSREVFDGLLQGKQQWEDKNLEVTIIPTYDTDTLGYWVVDSEDALAEARIDLAPSASRCTINLQDHETSCSAYRLEF